MASMTFNLKLGAIICVETDTGSVYTGKVKDLTASTIVLISQYFVLLNKRAESPATLLIDGSKTVDSYDLTFINKDKIVAWWYDNPAFHEDDDIAVNCIRPDEISDDDVVNQFDEYGFHKGEGDTLE